MSNLFDLIHKKTEPNADAVETEETAVELETIEPKEIAATPETIEPEVVETKLDEPLYETEPTDSVETKEAIIEEETECTADEADESSSSGGKASLFETEDICETATSEEIVEAGDGVDKAATDDISEETPEVVTECANEEALAATAVTTEEATVTVSEPESKPETEIFRETATAADCEPEATEPSESTTDCDHTEGLDAQYKQIRFSNITAKIDLDCTLPTVTSSEILTKAEQAKKYGFASVCILASRMKIFKKQAKEQAFCAVIAYPSGEMTEKSKLCEIKEATLNGAREIDVFFRISALKDEKRKQIVRSLVKYGKAIGKKRVYKLSFDCGMASEEEARFIVSAAVEAKVDYLVIRNCAENDVRTRLFYAGLCAGRCKLEFSDNAFDLSSISRLSDIGTSRFLLTDAFEIADCIKQEIESSVE